jgi:hypothetical protein
MASVLSCLLGRVLVFESTVYLLYKFSFYYLSTATYIYISRLSAKTNQALINIKDFILSLLDQTSTGKYTLNL